MKTKVDYRSLMLMVHEGYTAEQIAGALNVQAPTVTRAVKRVTGLGLHDYRSALIKKAYSGRENAVLNA